MPLQETQFLEARTRKVLAECTLLKDRQTTEKLTMTALNIQLGHAITSPPAILIPVAPLGLLAPEAFDPGFRPRVRAVR